MKKSLYRLLAWLMPLLLLACDKLPNNGDLDGMWQLMTVEHHASGEVVDLSNTQHYWSFRLRLVQFSAHKGINTSVFYAHFTHDGNTIHLYDFCSQAKYEKETDDNEWVSPAQANIFTPWGFVPQPDPSNPNKTTTSFHVEQLTSSSLILSNSTTTLSFRKF